MVSQIALIAVFCVLSLVIAIPNGDVLTESLRLVIPGVGVYRVLVVPALFGAALASWILLILAAMVERVLRRWAAEQPPVAQASPPALLKSPASLREGASGEDGERVAA